MELRHFRYFVAVAETRHFGNAAKRLRMAQPPLSQAIRQLEADLGAELFTRTTRRVELTEAGEAFYEDAAWILRCVGDTARRVKRIAEGKHGVLRLGLTGLASFHQLPRIARIVERDMPGVGLEIHSEMLTSTQEKALLNGEIDLGLLRPPLGTGHIACRRVARESLVLVTPEDHPLAARSDVAMSDLSSEKFVMYSAELRSVVNDAVVRSCLAAGFYPNREHEAAETSVLLALVAAGLGVALVPDSVRAVAVSGVRFVPVGNAGTVDLAMAWRAEGSSPLLDNLLRTLEDNEVFITDDRFEDTREDHRS